MINNNNVNKSPIIICGMHRSGTSLLTKILMRMNVYMGEYQDINNESIFFQRLNRWILSCLNSSWDSPQSMIDIPDNDLDIIINKIDKSLKYKSTNFIYFGIKKMLFNHQFSNIDYKWGWKDPSNTFTLPIWKNIFLDSKIIYILRHPLDVSISLLKRNNKLKKIDSKNNMKNILSKYVSILTIAKGGIGFSFNINSLNDCLKLYNIYYNEILKYKNDTNVLFVKYEDILLDTNNELVKIFNFLNIKSNHETISGISKELNINRAFVYKSTILDDFSKSLINHKVYDEK